jgi:glycosyltransferase involved in cell wall biosynthesis
MVGTVEPRKGYDAALAAFEHLWAGDGERAPQLLIVGKPGWKTEDLQQRIRAHREHGRRLHWLSGVSDDGLCRLYEASRGLLMASRGEGMGLPLVEAAMHGCAILARDLPVFREQGLTGVLYFDDERPAALAGKLRELASVDASVVRPCLPTWRDMVDQLLLLLGFEPGQAHLQHAQE